MSIRTASRLGRAMGLCLLTEISCQPAPSEPETGGETHFLTACDDSADSCGTEFACVCNVCSIPCAEQETCSGLPNARCVQLEETSTCGGVTAAGRCELTCASDTDCSVLSARHTCVQGACRVENNAQEASDASACGSAALDLEQFDANQIVILGDAFFATTHEVTGFLEDQARATGLLAPGERYRDASSVTNNTLALGGNGLAAQYASARAEGDVRVVIMNGGGADALIGTCDTLDANCPIITSAALAAAELFAQMAADGVAQVVYTFYPDPDDTELQDKLDLLRPAIRDVCDGGPVACEWLDLRTRFSGQEDAYLQSGGLTLTSEGARAAAEEIWAVLQNWCSE